MSSWIEAVVAANEQIIACERRFHRQRARVIGLALERRVTAEDEMLLASYMTAVRRRCRQRLPLRLPAAPPPTMMTANTLAMGL